MADEQHHSGETVDVKVEDRGLLDFIGKKKEQEGEKYHDEVLVTEFEKVKVAEEEEAKEERKEKEEKEKEGLLEKLHRTHGSSSSSSSDEEEAAEGENEGEKKKKKKSLKEKISGEKKEGAEEQGEKVKTEASAVVDEDNTIPVEKIEELAQPESETQEKKNLLEEIKEKLPGGGQHKKPEEEAPAATDQCVDQGKEHHEGDSPKEKGFLEKIMDKIPGYHKSDGEEETSTASN